MRSNALVVAGVIAGLLGALWFSTVVALGPAPGSFGAHSGAEPKPSQVKPEPKVTEEETSCRNINTRDECIVQLRAARAAEAQALYAFWGFVALIVTLAINGVATWAATRAARAAEGALTDLERPHVFVEVADAGLQMENDGSFRFAGGRFEHKCVNYGRTPAALTEYLPKILVLDAGHFPAPIDPEKERGRELPTGCITSQGAPYTEGDTAMKTYDWKLHQAEAAHKHSIYFIGYVRYSDMIFGARYINGFCFVYDHIGGRFVRRGDNQKYNYMRQEKVQPKP